jgi:hypothetical protein
MDTAGRCEVTSLTFIYKYYCLSFGLSNNTMPIKRTVFLDFIHHLVSREQTKLRKLKIIDKRTQYTRPQTNHTRINY